MANCFVIQPFDRGPYDKRYSELLVPAITNAGLDAYRVDQDPNASILIDNIEQGIRDAEVCLADITSNNPNVWYEVGFAMSCGKPVVLICAEPRPEPFPFDIRHRAIITYTTHSSGDFEKLKKEVTSRLKAQAKKAEELQTVATLSQVNTVEGDLSPHEVALLITIMSVVSMPYETVTPNQVKDSMRRSGYTAMASTLALASLHRKEMIEYQEESGDFNQTYTVLQLSRKGVDWMLENEHRFRLRREDAEPTIRDEDIPF
jgi:hypothetical protein